VGVGLEAQGQDLLLEAGCLVAAKEAEASSARDEPCDLRISFSNNLRKLLAVRGLVA
jgi:hypothetical protein